MNTQAGTVDYGFGIQIDPTPRIRCLAKIALPTSDPGYGPSAEACVRENPARVSTWISESLGRSGWPPA